MVIQIRLFNVYVNHRSTICFEGRDGSIGKSSASHAGDLGSNPDGGLTGITPMHE